MPHTTETLEKTRNARLETRVSSDQKSLFQRAATLSGRSLSEFVIDSAQEAATRIIKEHEVIRLTLDEQEAFVTALLAPSVPGSRLSQAARNYRMKTGL